jgi:4-hydroxybenzoate polyprenyltransferase
MERSKSAGQLIWLSMRPRHWVKNILIFVPLVFARDVTHFAPFVKALIAFIIFCGISGAGYLLNDVIDREGDRLHKIKANRPIAAGQLAIRTALRASLLIFVISLALSFVLGRWFGWAALAFTLVFVAYSLVLKNVVIVDLFTVAAGYVLRVVAGAVVISVALSNWLLITAMLLSLFLALSKRSVEIRVLQEDAQSHSALLVAYTLYTRSPETMQKFHTAKLVYTVPFVLYGIFRYLYLVHIREGYHTLERVLVTDKPMIINLGLYCLAVLAILYL